MGILDRPVGCDSCGSEEPHYPKTVAIETIHKICACPGCFRAIPENCAMCVPCEGGWHGPGGLHGYGGGGERV